MITESKVKGILLMRRLVGSIGSHIEADLKEKNYES